MKSNESLIRDYLAQGGKITKIETDARGEVTETKRRGYMMKKKD